MKSYIHTKIQKKTNEHILRKSVDRQTNTDRHDLGNLRATHEFNYCLMGQNTPYELLVKISRTLFIKLLYGNYLFVILHGITYLIHLSCYMKSHNSASLAMVNYNVLVRQYNIRRISCDK